MQLVAFDLDDTLYPEEEYVRSGFAAVAQWAQEALGIPLAQGLVELTRLFDAGVRGNTFDQWLAQHGISPDSWIDTLIGVYRGHEPRIRPYADVVPALRALRPHYRLGLVSDGYLEAQKRKLSALGIETMFDIVVFSDEIGRDAWKPSVRPFHVLLHRAGLPGQEVVYVGDNPAKDFAGARLSGIRTVRIRRPDGIHRDLEPAGPDHAPDFEIPSLDGLLPILDWLARDRSTDGR